MTKKQIANGKYITSGNTRSFGMTVVADFDNTLISEERAKQEYLDLCQMIVDDPEGFLVVKNA